MSHEEESTAPLRRPLGVDDVRVEVSVGHESSCGADHGESTLRLGSVDPVRAGPRIPIPGTGLTVQRLGGEPSMDLAALEPSWDTITPDMLAHKALQEARMSEAVVARAGVMLGREEHRLSHKHALLAVAYSNLAELKDRQVAFREVLASMEQARAEGLVPLKSDPNVLISPHPVKGDGR